MQSLRLGTGSSNTVAEGAPRPALMTGWCAEMPIGTKYRAIGEVRLHGYGTHLVAGPFRAECNRNSFVGLYPQRDYVVARVDPQA